MTSSIIMPKHFFVSQGQLVQRSSVEVRSSPPKVIDYVHTIRILSNNCDHGEMIKGVHDSYRLRLLEKDREIQDLNKVIQVRDEEIKRKNEEIQKYQEKIRERKETKLELSVIEPNLEKSILMETNKLKISSIMNHTQLPNQSELFLGEFSRHKQIEQDNEQILKIKKEMKSTEQALSSITNLLQKPKKKYQFFNSNLRQSKSQLQSPCVSQKLSDSNFKSQVFISNKKQPTPFYQMDLSISKTDESRDTFDFIAQTTNQDPVVSSFLVNWQPTVNTQINMMKQHDDETKLTINLDSQNDKRQVNNLNQSIVDLLQDDQGHHIEKNDCKYLQQMRFILNSTEMSQ